MIKYDYVGHFLVVFFWHFHLKVEVQHVDQWIEKFGGESARRVDAVAESESEHAHADKDTVGCEKELLDIVSEHVGQPAADDSQENGITKVIQQAHAAIEQGHFD